MKPILFRLALLSLLFAGAGCTTYSEQLFVGTDDYVIATRTAADGVRESFVLDGGRHLRMMTAREQQRPFLGFQVVEIDKGRAARRGVAPYSGLLVDDTYPESSARLAGIRTNDVLLQVGGREVIYLEQLREVEAGLADGQDVVCRVLRGDAELDVHLETQLLAETVSDVQGVQLEACPRTPRPYAGVTLHGIPAVWCERMFDDVEQAIVISQVEVGSPAWLGGFRGGDILVAVDGRPVPPVKEFAKRLRESGEGGATMAWKVRREAGTSYEGTVELADYSGTTRFHVPILWSSANGAYEDRWRIGWGLVMGNRNTYVSDQSTRRVETRNKFSALLGLIKVDSEPDVTRVRLLWVISFET